MVSLLSYIDYFPWLLGGVLAQCAICSNTVISSMVVWFLYFRGGSRRRTLLSCCGSSGLQAAYCGLPNQTNHQTTTRYSLATHPCSDTHDMSSSTTIVETCLDSTHKACDPLTPPLERIVAPYHPARKRKRAMSLLANSTGLTSQRNESPKRRSLTMPRNLWPAQSASQLGSESAAAQGQQHISTTSQSCFFQPLACPKSDTRDTHPPKERITSSANRKPQWAARPPASTC